MRIAPLAFLLDPDVDSQRQTIRDVCRITHRNEEAYVGALAILRVIRRIVAGNALNSEVLSILIDALPDSRLRDRLIEVEQRQPTTQEYALQFSASGYVVDSVPLAILAAMRCTNLLDTIQQVVQCGGDTDTIASMCGQIVGAAHGSEVVPLEIVDQIDAARLVRETAANFSAMFKTQVSARPSSR